VSGDSRRGGDGPVEMDFLPSPESVRAARRFVLAAGWSEDRDVNTRLATLVSELATNAILHARTPFRVRILPRNDAIRISVTDRSSDQPVTRSYADTQPAGRGLRIVESMADRWGVVPAGDGKTVWFEIDRVAASA